MTGARARPGLLLLAHGERIDDPANAGVRSLLGELRSRRILPEIHAGLLAGHPAIGEGVAAFRTSDILVYPLFMADGYFLRKASGELEAAARKRQAEITLLPPLGTNPALADVIAARAQAAARAQGFSLPATRLVLVAHGSQREPASQQATDALLRRLREQAVFAAVQAAYLEQPPSFAAVLGAAAGPAVVVGLFMGSGLHGGIDVDRLIESAGSGVVNAGNVGTWAEIADLVADDIAARTGARSPAPAVAQL